MTSLRFLNGLTTIGGNIVEFTQGSSRVIMDFGVAADLTGETTESAIAAGKLPNLPDLLGDAPDAFAHEAIFISHLHIDHMGALQYLQRAIPIYLSEPSYRLYQTLIRLGIEPPVANLHPLAFETPLAIGSFTVTGFASDHDEPGAMALLVDDGEHRYAHSGDVRLNGPHRTRVEHWAQVMHAAKVNVLMLEGTTFSFDTDAPVEDAAHPSAPLTEASLAEALRAHLQAAQLLVVINPYQRNYERLATIQAVAAECGRTMVWEPQDAEILHTMTGVTPAAIIGDTVSLAEVATHPAAYLMETTFAHRQWLAQLPVSEYLHSNGEPLGDYDPRFAELQDWLAAQGIPLTFLSCTGHATKADLITLANWIAPQTIVPWHSFKPEAEAAALDAATNAAIVLPERDLYYDFFPESE
ncbi:MBL fold metallo-hydrolase [Lacticaseibacillus nasuensis]|uniref:MBL fold metallo-hydrolase n=1 Tax=Lacticaseibacillus nasuensis TaxID=944671 RepID=UPI0022483E6A|nr:MBL fold metallo-hydrolase [Lacticaseibacillus nasuensis]MCX2454718.1 MBL fold metallo-hydrolase [Lacticaseibacillus nasuensis]